MIGCRKYRKDNEQKLFFVSLSGISVKVFFFFILLLLGFAINIPQRPHSN